MTTHNAVSGSITNFDASPAVGNAAGYGGAGLLAEADDYVTVPASAAAGSVFRILRLRSNVILKSLVFASEAQTVGKVELGAYYPDDARYVAGGSGLETGAAISAACFSGDIDCSSAVVPTEKILAALTMDKLKMPLWQAVGLSSDPGGYIDICATVHTTDVTTGTGKLGLTAKFIAP